MEERNSESWEELRWAQFVLATGQRFYTESMRHPRGFGTQLKTGFVTFVIREKKPSF